MTTLTSQLFPVNPSTMIVAAAAQQPSWLPATLLGLLIALFVLIGIARLVGRLLALFSHLVESAAVAVTGLVSVFAIGSAVLAVVVLFVGNR